MTNDLPQPPLSGAIPPASPAASTTTVHATVPVIEEQVLVGKRTVETGTVQITKTITEGPEPVHVVVSHDETSVERVPVDKIVEVAPEVRQEGDTLIIPVLKEVAVVVKKILVVEELRITKRAVQTQVTEQVSIRREHIDITRTPAAGTGPANPSSNQSS